MMPQQSPAYTNVMNNQQQNIYSSTAGNPTISRTPNQTPMSISNQQWTTNQTVNVGRQLASAYTQVKI